jgi:type IV secretory pathway VirB3-like protein
MRESFRVYPLFLGLTRPPMTMGVTQTFFVLNFIPCMIVFLLTMNLLIASGIFIIMHLFGVACCWKDERFFDILLGKFELICPNKRLWRCNSYDPN